MEKQLDENRAMETTQPITDSRPLAEQIREVLQQPQEQRSEAYQPQGWGLLDVLLDTYTSTEPESMDDAERRRRKRKKQEAQSRGIKR